MLGMPAGAAAAVPLLPLEEVQVGAQGVARTVIAGTRIEEFGVEVLGILKNKGAVGDLILVRTYGDVKGTESTYLTMRSRGSYLVVLRG